ncbi:DUF4249 domain-containing protein [Mucilaginibacter calamicampi]|uniref:DUF4249 domain-containing protein n=1 Tax=Mucilaginibacter calamicampi TaxID=1302352 RepID=A0ABW2YS63_9SPHI
MLTFSHGKHIKAKISLIIMGCIVLYACKERFLPEIKDNNLSYLVVEGLINTGADSTIYTLSRTFKLGNKPIEAPEKGAIVQVESEAGGTYVLPALPKPGRYGRPSLGLDPTKKYRLRIRTTDKREYLSDFVESKTSQPFELKHVVGDTTLNFYLTTHDPAGKSIYYRHSYIETWEYQTDLISYFKIVNDKRVPREFPQDDISTCWHTFPSHEIILTSTANLSEDRLNDKLILSIGSTEKKINIEYSILVKQSVLTREGFEFYESLRKNTESVGTIFDAQPSQLFGNIRSTTNPSETVIGFISAGSVTEKRFIIQLKDFPSNWFALDDKSICEESLRMPTDIRQPFIVVGITSSTNYLYCADCIYSGGNRVRPPYWK